VDGSLNREAQDLLGSARALVEELAEEGVDRFDEVPAPAVTTAAPETSAPAATSRPAESEPTRGPVVERPAEPPPIFAEPAPLGLAFEATWGPNPTLDDVRTALGDCTRCKLHEKRRTIVFGDGNPDADLMFVGEGPGENEDAQGLPFVGRAGELLTQMIEKGLGIARADTYICNIVKCRPPENRTPLPNEVSTCRPYLDGQIDAVRPKVIVALGKPAASLLLGRDVPITRVRGTWHEYRGIPLMPTLHPAYVLRQYTQEVRRNVWNDLKAALERTRS